MERFTKSDLISFGQYLLSEERARKFRETAQVVRFSVKERLSQVHDADFQNWLEARNRKPESFLQIKTFNFKSIALLHIPAI